MLEMKAKHCVGFTCADNLVALPDTALAADEYDMWTLSIVARVTSVGGAVEIPRPWFFVPGVGHTRRLTTIHLCNRTYTSRHCSKLTFQTESSSAV